MMDLVLFLWRSLSFLSALSFISSHTPLPPFSLSFCFLSPLFAGDSGCYPRKKFTILNVNRHMCIWLQNRARSRNVTVLNTVQPQNRIHHFKTCHVRVTPTRPSLRPCARACLWRWSLDAVAVVFVRALLQLLYTSTPPLVAVSTVTQLVRLDAKTVTVEITLTLTITSDWRITNANNITLNPLLAVTHLAPPCVPSPVSWPMSAVARYRPTRPCVPPTGALSYNFSYLTTTRFYS